MPSTMIHLMVAREVEPDGEALFWVGNFAPDCVTEREKKDPIHLRDRPDRWAALAELRAALKIDDPLARESALRHRLGHWAPPPFPDTLACRFQRCGR